MKILKHIICLFLGHKKEIGLFEEKLYLYKSKCKRCDKKLGLPHLTEYNILNNFPIPKQI